MDTITLAIIGAAVVAAIVGIALLLLTWNRRREDSHLQQVFGAEYDRTYASAMNRGAARAELKARENRVSAYELQPLAAEDRHRFMNEWQAMQATFVDDPNGAVNRADALLTRVMRARGYETDAADKTARIDDISVGHADEAEAFREANRLAALNRAGRASTEDLRRAIKHYGTVFDSLLNERQPV